MAFRYSIFVLLALLIYGVTSCTYPSNPKDDHLESASLDSINSWISAGKNRNFSINHRLQQLKKAHDLIEELDNDSLRLKSLSKLSLAYMASPDSLSFRRTNSKVMMLARTLNDSIAQAEAHWDLGDFYMVKSFLDSAYYHHSEAQKLYSAMNKNFEVARMLYNMAVSQSSVKDYTGSEISAIRAIEILKSLNKNKQLYQSYNILGAVSKELNEYDRAIDYYNTALKYQEKIPEENTFDLSIKNNIGGVYQKQGKYKESVPYFEEVIRTDSLFQKKTALYALALNNLAYSNLKLGRTNNLPEQFQRAISIQDSIDDITGIARSYYGLAEYYLVEKDTAQALVQAKKAKKYAENASNFERLLETLQLLVKLEPEKSIAYNGRYIALNDSLQQEERKIRDKFTRIRFETDEFIAENKMLAREKQLWTGIAAAILLLGLMSFVILDQRSKNQKLRFQQEQQAANQEIFNLMLAQTQKVEEGKKLEQKRISEELHDGVLGKMLGARMVLTGLNKKTDSEAETQRKKAIDALQDVEKEVRAISHELSHAAYQKINNFVHSLDDLLKTVQVTGKFNYEFNHDKEFDWDGLNGNTKINLYRIIQESLQNSVKHAHCENVNLNLQVKEQKIKITVVDDGKGFKQKAGKKGIGMRNIDSRVKKLNGEWGIESAVGKGTKVKLEIPLEKINVQQTGEPLEPEIVESA